jgi:hypothetical protein
MQDPFPRTNMWLDTQWRVSMPEIYAIKLKGHLDSSWSACFAGLKLSHPDNNITLLSGPLPDQAALHGVLEYIRDLNLTLISVTCESPSPLESKKE